MLDPRSIALQGFGSAPRFVAMQGLVPYSVQPPSVGGTALSSGASRHRRVEPRKDKDDDVLMFLLR